MDPYLDPAVRSALPHDPVNVGATGVGVGDPEISRAIVAADKLVLAAF